ncbi:MAG TPA: S9 family peptidase [Steroidobacteraceae bacterium]|nr:S9 family peptidase [Steroidobacteraceae bacterium]
MRIPSVFLAVSLTLMSLQVLARPFTANDLVMLDRVSEPRLAPDGRSVAFTLRQTDFEGNRGLKSIWKLDLTDKAAQPQRLTATGSNAWSARWSPDGKTLYFLSNRSGSDQVWSLATGLGEARQVTHLPMDVGSYRLAPDGKRLALSLAVFTDCADLACTKQRLADRTASKESGMVYDRLFVRHWDMWSDGTRLQLFIADLAADGTVSAEPRLLTRNIDGDVPSKPDGDESEYAFAPDSKSVYFDVRIAGTSEPWSTNFDVYGVPVDGSAPPRNLTADNIAWDGYPLPSADGRKLFYLAMKRPQHESDRFGIMELDLATGARREIDPNWDRSPGPLQLSADGKTLYTLADDVGEHPLFAIDIATGRATKVAAGGNVSDFSRAGTVTVIARDSFKSPGELYLVGHGSEQRLTDLNAARLKDVGFGDFEAFTFKGWNGDTVHGYVVKPVGFEPGHKYPVAFVIHGGPQGSSTNEFHYRWNPQTYAGAGFAVVEVDFHGSTGYGQAFTDAISGHWGDRPLEDLQKGWAAALAQFPFLAADRACALGASYGGFMINWIAGNWPTPQSGPWRCLISHDGVFDARMMYYATEELWFEEVEQGGTPWQQPQNYERFNPITHVGDWKVPMLIIHSAKDYRIPLSQGLGAFTALQRRGVPSQFLTFPDENHWVLKPRNSLEWHRTVEAWLKKWTSP